MNFIYQKYGEAAFDDKPWNKSYSKELKLQVIQDYFEGKGSQYDLAFKYNILSPSMVTSWLKVYNSGKELRNYNPKGEVYKMKARKTTFEERLEIVKFILDHDKQYPLAASKFKLTYSLIYQWTKKYLESGEDALKHKKKGPKPKDYIPDNLSETEKLRRKNEILKRQLEYSKLETEVLKKKEQFEREIELQRLGRKKI